MGEYALLYILFAPFAGALALIFVSNRQALLVRGIAAAAAGISLIASLYLFYAYDPVRGGFQFVQRYEWSKQLGISLYLGVDGIGTPLVLASSILLFAGIFVSWHIKDRTKEFYIWLLILAAATIGVFMSLDLFFLYFFYEMSVIPMYLLLGMWGSHTKKYLEMTDPEGLKLRDSVGFIFNFASNSKEYAAMKLVLFLSAFAVVALMGILLIYKYSGLNTFDILVLREQAKLMNIPVLGTTLDKIIWVLIFFGFASIAPLWPLHSWSPVGHAAAPAATSMLHAFSIIYGGFVAFYAKDTKYVIGYSSSSHMGYVFLGMAALDYISLSGAVIYMFAHAMATGMLFAMAGWVYDQTHTRDIPSLGGLSNKMPFISACFIVGCMASIGMPGTVNFIAEIMIIVGSWNKYPFQVIIAVLGIVLTMAYLFKMMRGLFYGPMDQKYSHSHDAVSAVDRLPLLIMIAVSIGFGIFPMHLYNVVRSGVDPLVAKITRVVPVASQEEERSPQLAASQSAPSGLTADQPNAGRLRTSP
jgi:NADH-quinone oxidoreductase subunit M